MHNVGIVVDDLEAAMSFFGELGMELDGEMPVEGRWVDGVVAQYGDLYRLCYVRGPDGIILGPAEQLG